MSEAETAEPDLRPAPADSIVVGHDGSDAATHAVSMAFDLAECLGVTVVVVRAWSIANAPRPDSWRLGYAPPLEDYATAVQAQLQKDVAKVVEDHPDVPVELRTPHASATRSLIEVSRGARMLIVGSRGRGGLPGMLLGSVGEQCVRHAACPVLVARAPVH